MNRTKGQSIFFRNVGKDFIQMSALMAYTFVLVYFVGGSLRDLLFLPLLVLAVYSRKKYFWFAYLFLLINRPAFFFARTTNDAVFRLPLYNLTSGISFAFTDLLLILFILFTFQDWFKKQNLIIGQNSKILGLYFILISLPLTFLFGTSLLDFANKLRFVVFYATVPIAFATLRSRNEIYLFIYLLFPYVFIIIADQFFVASSSIHWIETIDFKSVRYMPNSETGGIRPIPGGINILLLTMVFGLFLPRDLRLFRGIGELVFATGFLAFFISATRSMTAMAIVMLLTYTVLSKNALQNLLAPLVGIAVVFFVITQTGLVNSKILTDAMVRMELFQKLMGGVNRYEVDQLDTFGNRLENEVPIVMAGIKQNPVLGVGLSHYFTNHYNNDVGFFNTILMLGYVGFVLFLGVVTSLFLRMFRYRKRWNDPELRSQLNTMISAWAAVMTGYVFTWDFFQFYPHKVAFVSILLALPDIFRWLATERNKEYEGNEKKVGAYPAHISPSFSNTDNGKSF